MTNIGNIMKATKFKKQLTNNKQERSKLLIQYKNTDTCYHYLMSMNNKGIASQNNTDDFIRSVN